MVNVESFPYEIGREIRKTAIIISIQHCTWDPSHHRMTKIGHKIYKAWRRRNKYAIIHRWQVYIFRKSGRIYGEIIGIIKWIKVAGYKFRIQIKQ